MKNEVYFLHADKHQSLLQVYTIILGDSNESYPKYPKQASISLQYLHKSMGDEVDFLPADKNKTFLQDVIVSVWVCVAISQGKREE